MNAYDDASRSQVKAKDRYIESSGTPPGCRPNNIAFPVVSADSDHRLLSLQPFGLRWGGASCRTQSRYESFRDSHTGL